MQTPALRMESRPTTSAQPRGTLQYCRPPPVSTEANALVPTHAVTSARAPGSNLTLTSARHPQHYLSFPYVQLEEKKSCATLSEKSSVPWAACRPPLAVTRTESPKGSGGSGNTAQTLAVLADKPSGAQSCLTPSPTRCRDSLAWSRPTSTKSSGGSRQGSAHWRFLTPQALGVPAGRTGARKLSSRPGSQATIRSASGEVAATAEGSGMSGVGLGGPLAAMEETMLAAEKGSLERVLSAGTVGLSPCAPAADAPPSQRLCLVHKYNRTDGGKGRLTAPLGRELALREEQREWWALETLRGYLPPASEPDETTGEARKDGDSESNAETVGWEERRDSRFPPSGRDIASPDVAHRLRTALSLPAATTTRPFSALRRSGSTATVTVAAPSPRQRARPTTADRFAQRMEGRLYELADEFHYVPDSHERERLLHLAVILGEQEIQREFLLRHPLADARQSSFDPLLLAAESRGAGGEKRRLFGLSKHTASGRREREAHPHTVRVKGYEAATATTTASDAPPHAAADGEVSAVMSLADFGRDRDGEAGSCSNSARQAEIAALLLDHERAITDVAALERAAERSLENLLDKYKP